MKKDYAEIRKIKLKNYIERLLYLKRGAGKTTDRIISEQVLKFEHKIKQIERENQH
jgi:hypothetical protein